MDANLGDWLTLASKFRITLIEIQPNIAVMQESRMGKNKIKIGITSIGFH